MPPRARRRYTAEAENPKLAGRSPSPAPRAATQRTTAPSRGGSRRAMNVGGAEGTLREKPNERSAEEVPGQSLLGFRAAIFELQELRGFTDEPRRYTLTLLGLQLIGLSRSLLCTLLLLGIYSSWFTHGYLEERLSRAGEDFPMWPLTCLQFFTVSLLSTLSSRLADPGAAAAPSPPSAQSRTKFRVAFFAQAVLVVLSQGVSNDANNHMSYPTKLLFKASKLIPIMLVGTFIFRKRYHPAEWLSTCFLVGGLCTVLLGSETVLASLYLCL